MTTVENVDQDAVLTEIENLAPPTVEMVSILGNVFSGRSVDGNVSELDLMDSSCNFDDLRLTNDRFK